MSDLKLMLATPENGLMDRVIVAWDKQAAILRLPASALNALRTYEQQLKPSPTYGVYILCKPDEETGGKAPYEALVHINHAFPRHPKPMLRLVWHRFAPKYQRSADPLEHGRLFGGIINQALELSKGSLKSSEVKLYLPEAVDRKFAQVFSASLTRLRELPFVVRVRGGWLHFEWK